MKRMNFLIGCFIIAICACGNTKPGHTDTAKATDTPTEASTTVNTQGTVFFDITFEQALEKAKAENKFVLINFHTKTCGPCKKMEKTVFPNPICGKFVNEHFVPIMIDGEDGGTGQEIAKKYDIFIFPTYLVLLPDGFKEGEIAGAEFDVNRFLDMLKSIIKIE